MKSLDKMLLRVEIHHKFRFYCLFETGILIVVLVIQLCNLGYSEPQFISSFCYPENGTYTSNSSYRSNLSLVFFNLTSAASLKGFSNFTVGDRLDKVYALFYCRGDLKLADCNKCVETATSRIVFECSNEKEAIVFFDECTFRYANRNIFSLEEENPNDWSYSKAMVSNQDQFDDVLTAAMSGPMYQAAKNSSNNGFATGIIANSSANQTLYCLAQCTPDIPGTSCNKCLIAALGNLLGEGKTAMSLFMPSCQVMYSLAPFFNNGTTANSPPVNPALNSPPVNPASNNTPPIAPSSQVQSQYQKNRKKYIGVGVAIAALGLLFICIALWVWMNKRSVKDKGTALQFSHNEHNTFTHQELTLATDNFSRANILGQGGFGYVYKGVLPNGKEIAVKQLKIGSAQGEREFQAEVETISRVHHRHLVSLVGYCISGDERMLVYEFIPNKT